LREIISYIADENPDAAERVEDRLVAATRHLLSHPEMGRPGRVPGTRELVVASTSYIVPYRVRGERVELLAILHTARPWPSSFDEA
jgi:toxin ParE1/3/4